MTANPHSIDLSALVAEHLERAEPDMLRAMLGSDSGVDVGVAEALCGARCGVRAADRTSSRNGYRARDFDTCADAVALAIPKLRQRPYFPEWLSGRHMRPNGPWSVAESTTGERDGEEYVRNRRCSRNRGRPARVHLIATQIRVACNGESVEWREPTALSSCNAFHHVTLRHMRLPATRR
jgi:Transposase, Mutator family